MQIPKGSGIAAREAPTSVPRSYEGRAGGTGEPLPQPPRRYRGKAATGKRLREPEKARGLSRAGGSAVFAVLSVFFGGAGGAGAAAGGRAVPAGWVGGWVGGGLGGGGGWQECKSLPLAAPRQPRARTAPPPLAARPRQPRGQRAGSPRSSRPSAGWQQKDEEPGRAAGGVEAPRTG